jgi:hypothetical protein
MQQRRKAGIAKGKGFSKGNSIQMELDLRIRIGLKYAYNKSRFNLDISSK